MLRLPALFTVPGDALAGAAAAGRRPNRRTGLAVAASLCLYQAGMALNDWADRDEDAAERPHRPIPSGRIAPRAALAAGVGLTVAGLALASRAGRSATVLATALAGTVWAYDLRLKHTPAGPAVMATARSLDLLLGAAATARPARSSATPAGTAGWRGALGPAAALGAHTAAVTLVSRRETQGGSPVTPLAALGVTAGLGAWTSRHRPRTSARDHAAPPGAHTVPATVRRSPGRPRSVPDLARAALALGYAATAAKPLFHAVLNPSPPLTQRAVGGGIRAMIPLQAALAARSGAAGTAVAVAGLVPLARRLSRKVSPT
nr:UbiA family prenyltransferase [Wenjunlia vitaminophila]